MAGEPEHDRIPALVEGPGGPHLETWNRRFFPHPRQRRRRGQLLPGQGAFRKAAQESMAADPIQSALRDSETFISSIKWNLPSARTCPWYDRL